MSAPNPQFAETIANAILVAVFMVIGFRKRRKQNDKLADKVGEKVNEATETGVEAVKKEISLLKQEQEITQTRTAIQTDKIMHLDNTMSAMGQRLDRFEEVLPKAEDALNKIANALERLKAGTLVEKPIEGSGGLVTLKKEEK